MRAVTGGCVVSTACVILGLLAFPPAAHTADRYYVGPDNGSWSDPASWSATAGGAGGAGVPVPGDRAFITGTMPVAVGFAASYVTPLRTLTLDGASAQM